MSLAGWEASAQAPLVPATASLTPSLLRMDRKSDALIRTDSITNQLFSGLDGLLNTRDRAIRIDLGAKRAARGGSSGRAIVIAGAVGAGLGILLGERVYRSDFGGGSRVAWDVGFGIGGAAIGAFIGYILSRNHGGS